MSDRVVILFMPADVAARGHGLEVTDLDVSLATHDIVSVTFGSKRTAGTFNTPTGHIIEGLFYTLVKKPKIVKGLSARDALMIGRCVYAARCARLPNGYECGKDAMDAFDFGKSMAVKAIRQLANKQRRKGTKP